MNKFRKFSLLLALIFAFSSSCPKNKVKSLNTKSIFIGLSIVALGITAFYNFFSNFTTKDDEEDSPDNLDSNLNNTNEENKNNINNNLNNNLNENSDKKSLENRKKSTEIIVVLDKSGSMYHLKESTIKSFNEMLESQKNLVSEFPAYLTTVAFSNNSQKIHNHEEIHTVNNMANEDYNPRGCTALFDTLGKTINEISEINKNNDKNIIFIIITDGYENASVEFKREDIKKMIEDKQKIGWNFIFFGANIDSCKEAESLGINRKNARNFEASDAGISRCMYKCNEFINKFRN